jgi:preprotein translocase subunit SecF
MADNSGMMKDRICYLILVGALLVLSSAVVSAFGIVSRYDSATMPLEMYPGQSVDTYFKIQNSESSEITIESSLQMGSEIAKMTSGTTYKIPANDQREVNLRVTVPRDAPIGSEYIVKGVFNQIGGDAKSEGMLQFVINVKKDFKVVVVPKPEGEGMSTVMIVLLVLSIVIVLVIIWLVLKGRKQKEMAPVKSQLAEGSVKTEKKAKSKKNIK